MRIKKLTFLAAVFAFGFLAVGNVANALDTITMNSSTALGIEGTTFVPEAFFGGSMKPCIDNPEASDIASTSLGNEQDNGACVKHGKHVVKAWLDGNYFDPRNGTKIIPPSGDHHRSGWRLMMQSQFSAGLFLTGFAPFLNTFPNFPQVGTPGPSSSTDNDLLLLFLDAHGEPLTPGRFPRYIPHERQAWADTLMVKYVSSGGSGFGENAVSLLNSSLRSQVGQWRGDGQPDNAVTWMSMSTEDATGCGEGNCIWTFHVGTDGKAGTPDDYLARISGEDGTAGKLVVVMYTDGTAKASLRVSSFFAGGDGTVDSYKVMTPIEAVPTIIDDRLDQSLSHAGNSNMGLQVLRYQVQVVSGPNFAAEEGSDPYTWQICGSRTGGAGETDCTGFADGNSDGLSDIINETVQFAFISGNPDGTTGTFGGGAVYSHAERFGSDGRFFTADDGLGADGTKGTSDDTIVVCDGSGIDGYSDGTGIVFFGANCNSDPGDDLVYGTGDDGVIYYKEAIENGFRSGTRENRAFSFSFLDAQTQLRQLMEQGIGSDGGGFLSSCLNCNSDADEHPALGTFSELAYDQIWPQTPMIDMGTHPPAPTDSFVVVPLVTP